MKMNEIYAIERTPCQHLCDDKQGVEVLFKTVGTDLTKVRTVLDGCLNLGIACVCRVCSVRLLRLSEALSFHEAMLIANRNGDLEGTLKNSRERGRLLDALGCKTI